MKGNNIYTASDTLQGQHSRQRNFKCCIYITCTVPTLPTTDKLMKDSRSIGVFIVVFSPHLHSYFDQMEYSHENESDEPEEGASLKRVSPLCHTSKYSRFHTVFCKIIG